MENLASTYFNREGWNEAEQLQVQVVDIQKKLLGPEHPDTLKSMEWLTTIRKAGMRQGKWTLKSWIKKIGQDFKNNNNISLSKYKKVVF